MLCAGLENGLYREYPEKRCQASPKPEQQAACFRRPCSTWFTTSWSQVGLRVVGKGQGRPRSPGWRRSGSLLCQGSAESGWDPELCSSAEQAAG